jgi:hypothetical protein
VPYCLVSVYSILKVWKTIKAAERILLSSLDL